MLATSPPLWNLSPLLSMLTSRSLEDSLRLQQQQQKDMMSRLFPWYHSSSLHLLLNKTQALHVAPDFLKSDAGEELAEDDDAHIEVASNPPSPPPSKAPVAAPTKTKISFSVESIIGRPWNALVVTGPHSSPSLSKPNTIHVHTEDQSCTTQRRQKKSREALI